MMKHTLLAFLVLCVITALGWGGGGGKDRVLLSSVSALTLHKGRMTQARRVTAIPQMQCVGGPCHEADIEVAQCRNVGDAGGGDVQWSCTADMPKHVKFASISVSCEGYDNSDDEYVLKGSCGLEYSLKHVPGASRPSQGRHSGYSSGYDSYDTYEDDSGSGIPWFTIFIVGGVLYWIFFRDHSAARGERTGTQGGGGGGGGGGWFGGSGGGSGPYRGGGGGGGFRTNTGAGTYTETQYQQPRPAQNNGGPGFWTGLMGGFLANQLLNRTAYGRPHYGQQRVFTGGAGFGGGGGGGGGGTHTATGFGGTTRR